MAAKDPKDAKSFADQTDSDAAQAPTDGERDTLIKPNALTGDSAEVTLRKPGAASQADEVDVPAHWKVGDVILDTYEVKAELGKGAFGVVHRVHHKGWNTDLAVKSATGFLTEDEIRKIHREAEVWMELGLHPNIVSCFFVRNLGGSPRIFVEYVEGGTLHEWLYGRPPDSSEETAPLGQREDDSKSGKKPSELTRAQRLAIAIEMCRGMHHAHTFKWNDKDDNEHEGLVHRDLKPLNILMTEDGIPRVTDFGLVGFGLPTETTTASKDSGTTPESADKTGVEATLVKSERDGNVPNDPEEVDLSSVVDTYAIPTMVKKPTDDGSENATIRKPTQGDESNSDYYPDLLDPRTGATQLSIYGGNTAGTPPYMAPEQWDPNTPTTKAADIYAFGVILFELFCARRPFELPEEYAHADNRLKQAEYERMHSEEPPPDPVSLGPDVDSELARIMLQCLEKSPQNRPGSFATVRDRLKTIHQRLENEDFDTLSPEPKAAELLADSLNNKACSFLDLGGTTKAEVLWQEALEIDPLHVGATFNSHMTRWWNAQETDTDVLTALHSISVNQTEKSLSRYALALANARIRNFETSLTLLEDISDEESSASAFRLGSELKRHRENGIRLARLLQGHAAGVCSLAPTCESHVVATGSDDNVIRLWNIDSGACIRELTGATASVHQVTLDDDGRLLLSISDDYVVRVWDTLTGDCIQTFWDRLHGVKNGAFVPHTTYVVTVGGKRNGESNQNTVRLWDAATGAHVRTFSGTAKGVMCVVVTDDGSTVITGSVDGGIRFWDIESGTSIHEIQAHDGVVHSICLGKIGNFFATGGADGCVKLWAFAERRFLHTFKGSDQKVASVATSLDGALIVAASEDGVRLWDTFSGRCIRTITDTHGRIRTACFAGKEELVIASDDSVQIWTVPHWSHVRLEALETILLSRVTISDTRVAEDERFERMLTEVRLLADRGRLNEANRRLKQARAISGYERNKQALDLSHALAAKLPRAHVEGIWLLRTIDIPGKTGAPIGQSNSVKSIDLNDDGSLLVVGTDDGHLSMYNTLTGEVIWRIANHRQGATAVRFTEDQKWVLSAEGDFTIRLRATQSGALERELEQAKSWDGTVAPINGLIITPDRKYLIACDSHNIALWNIADGSIVASFSSRGRGIPMRCVALSPDACTLLSGGTNGMTIWDITSRKPIAQIAEGTHISEMSILAAGKIIIVAMGQVIQLWNLDSGSPIATLDGHTDFVRCLEVSQDDRWALSGSVDNTVRVWNLSTRTCERVLQGHASSVTSVCSSKSMQYFASGSDDGTVRVWEADWSLGKEHE